MSERERIRRWRQRAYARIMYAVGLILAAYMSITLLPALWESNIGRTAALAFTVWLMGAQAWALWLVWRWLSPLWRQGAPREER